jgi:hypothetical protein
MFLSPEGKVFTSRRAVLSLVESDPAYSPSDRDKVRRAVLKKRKRKVRSSWVPLRRRPKAQRRPKPKCSAGAETETTLSPKDTGTPSLSEAAKGEKETASLPTEAGLAEAENSSIGDTVGESARVEVDPVLPLDAAVGNSFPELGNNQSARAECSAGVVPSASAAEGQATLSKDEKNSPALAVRSSSPSALGVRRHVEDKSEAGPVRSPDAIGDSQSVKSEGQTGQTKVDGDQSSSLEKECAELIPGGGQGLFQERSPTYSEVSSNSLDLSPAVEANIVTDILTERMEQDDGGDDSSPTSTATNLHCQNVAPTQSEGITADNVILEPVDDLFQLDDDDDDDNVDSKTVPFSRRAKRSTECKFRRHNEVVEDEMVPELGIT